jgi:hypothetical protein
MQVQVLLRVLGGRLLKRRARISYILGYMRSLESISERRVEICNSTIPIYKFMEAGYLEDVAAHRV